MGLQIIQNSKGKATGVYIPINEWNSIKKKHKDLDLWSMTSDPILLVEKDVVLKNIKTGLEEVKLFNKGKLKTTSSKEFLNEL